MGLFRDESASRFKSAPQAPAPEGAPPAEPASGFVDRTIEQVSGMVDGTATPVKAQLVDFHAAGGFLPVIYGLIVFAVTALTIRQFQRAWLRRRQPQPSMAAQKPG